MLDEGSALLPRGARAIRLGPRKRPPLRQCSVALFYRVALLVTVASVRIGVLLAR